MRNRLHTLSPLLIFLFANGTANAHGYIESSRSKLCAEGVNTNCGAIRFEPQSVEGPDGFPEAGPPDATIAAAGSQAWAPLNEQSETRWQKIDVAPGAYVFHWTFTANHVTKDFRYFITRNDWDSSAPLSRSQFELDPFCVVDGGFLRPEIKTQHTCNVPIRQGYHVILSVWDVGDTAASFYSVVDAQFTSNGTVSSDTGSNGTETVTGGDPDSSIKKVGVINPSLNLEAGDAVEVRLFTKFGEQLDDRVKFQITNSEDGEAARWPFLLALLINSRGLEITAGVLDSSTGLATPQLGANQVYAIAGSSIERVEIGLNIIEPSAETDAKPSEVDRPVYPEDMGNYVEGEQVVTEDGHLYECKVTGWCNTSMLYYAPGSGLAWEQAWVLITRNFSEPLEQGTEFSYPEGRGTYIHGTLVSNAGVSYRCTVNNWCNSSSEYYYAPGTGVAWQQAWKIQQ